MKQIIPVLNKSAFTCPHCHSNAAQRWFQTVAKTPSSQAANSIIDNISTITEHVELVTIGGNDNVRNVHDIRQTISNLKLSKCFSCGGVAVWVGNRLIWPAIDLTIAPNDDMPAEIKADFEEAASIVRLSPRGAAALLRLALQKLISSIVGKPMRIDEGIQALVDAGLPPLVQKACDYVRIVGNDAVHPGQIDIKDDVDTAVRLFHLLNLIVTHTISFQKTIEEIYPALPPNKLKGVEDRMSVAAKKKEVLPPTEGSD